MEPSAFSHPVPRSVPREWAITPPDTSAPLPPAASSAAAVRAAICPSLVIRIGASGRHRGARASARPVSLENSLS